MTNTPPATIHLGDCIEVMRTLPENSVDAVITDPPYGLGFMGKAWDELPPGEEWARECLRVLKPGGHLLAFGGSRTWHRLAVAVEDAGFEVRDSIAWLYGSGFPKSLDVSKAIDKQRDDKSDARHVAAFLREQVKRAGMTAADLDAHLGGKHQANNYMRPDLGRTPPWETWLQLRGFVGFGDDMDAEVWRLNGRKGTPGEAWDQREVVGSRSVNGAEGSAGGYANGIASQRGLGGEVREIDITAPATPAAQQWQGFGTALKPAFEPIVVARKPLAGTVAANVLAHGTGALNIDGCRVGWQDESERDLIQKRSGQRTASDGWGFTPESESREKTHAAGRWPANVVLDESQAAALDQMSGPLSVNGPATYRRAKSDAASNPSSWEKNHAEGATRLGYGDSGGASRFFATFPREFDCCDSGERDPLDGARISECPPAPETSRRYYEVRCDSCGTREGLYQDADHSRLIELRDQHNSSLHPRFFYAAKAPTRERPKVDGVAHPTVKPLALMRWLVRLVTPPGGTVLEPFAGSGTTVEACALEGFACIAIEREPDYLPLIQARLARVEAAQPEPAGPSLFDIEATA